MQTNKSFFIKALTIGCLMLASAPVTAAGPVDAASLPGGATIFDSDGGSGESWGLAGGRTLAYSGFDLPNFTLLDWQGLSAGMAFDNEITGATLEEMTGPIQTAANQLQWSGQTTIFNDISNLNVTIYTRFTVTADTPFSGPPPEFIDVLAALGVFEINVLFEASTTGVGGWTPALTFFDNYPTAPAHDGYAITSFSHGFFYEVIEGMTIEEHDNNMQGRFDNVDIDLEYLTFETIGRLTDIGAKVYENFDKIIWAKSDIADLANQMGQDHSQILEGISQQFGFMVCLWIGDVMETCPEVPFDLPSIQGLADDLTTIIEKIDWAKMDIEALAEGQTTIIDKIDLVKMDTEALGEGQTTIIDKIDWAKMDIEAIAATISASRKVDITAVKSPRASSKMENVFMVHTTVNGVEVDAEVTSVQAVTEDKNDGIGVESPAFDATAVTTGFQSIAIDVSDGLTSTKTYLINVEYEDGDDTLQGSILVSAW